jgi:hypothetical protein
MKGKIKIDTILNPQQIEGLWRLLGKFVNVFAWNKGKFGCYIMEEHFINTQGFMLCHTNRLSCWKEFKVNKQIQALISMGKMRFNMYEYACD